MSDAMEALKNAVQELLEAARTGAIIPVRLPKQIEAIQQAVEQAEAEHAKAITELQSRPTGDLGDYMHTNAEFWKTAIHELRTPMTSIRGYGDMLSNPSMSGQMTPMQTQLLDVIRSNSRRMESLLADMSILNKINAGIVKVAPKMDMFKNIAMMVEKQVTPMVKELNRQFIMETPQGLPFLNIDGELLSLALVKLVENGLRYSPPETGQVKLSGQGDGSTLVILVEDNGCGMTEAEMARLGEIYYRADNEVVRAYKGSGLGVAIAYGLIRLLDGTVSVTSQPEHGTTFTIRLPGMA